MVLFNYSTKELTAKIVFYGPGLCGKTTNLQYIFENLPPSIHKGKMLSLATKTDRTLFFDFLPIDLGSIRGMRTRLQLYTVPGQVFYNTTRKLVLKGADGVVFVADSQRKMLEANIESFGNLEENLAEHNMKLADMPHIIQFNKRDLPDVATTEELNGALNKYNAPIYEAIATTGIGIHDTLKAVTRLVLNSLKERYGDTKKTEREPAAAMMAAAGAPGPKAEIAAARSSPARAEASPPPPMDLPAEPPLVEIDEEPVEAALSVESDEAILSVEEDEPVLSVEPEAVAEAIVEAAVEESPLILDEPVDSPLEEALPSSEEEAEIDLDSPLPSPPEEAPVLPIEISDAEGYEVEAASVDPPPATAPAAGLTVTTGALAVNVGAGASAETRAIHSAPGGPQAAEGARQASFPIVVNLQGQTLQIMLTISLHIDKS
jgi:signal recognition particle receptor subunit beta